MTRVVNTWIWAWPKASTGRPAVTSASASLDAQDTHPRTPLAERGRWLPPLPTYLEFS